MKLGVHWESAARHSKPCAVPHDRVFTPGEFSGKISNYYRIIYDDIICNQFVDVET